MRIFLLLGIFSIIVSCNGQTKEEINLHILNEPYNFLTKNKEVYNLRYYTYTDTLHSRIVLNEENIKAGWQPFTNGVKLDYFDLYFNENNKVIGFKGWAAESPGNITENNIKSIFDMFNKRSDYTPIKLNNKDAYFSENEWESKDYIIGIQNDKLNRSLCFIIINRNEIKKFYAEIFYAEFLNLTRNRIEHIIKLPKLNYTSTDADKRFYKEKFDELKKNNR
ncbi:hypothetical protein IV494_12645 [Kaistella sp. G5-32]|uniref:Lipoprotein n=1 Tax=Kaistella gelatinilytica TaxID=2787636 RepID=A0ABS0FED6_9FLAO|nr:hypothetical protein [Kaistella gelatinilytica]MBF8458027.1 hypothetical protein [Kaistella gelatinilytica]